MAWLGGAAASGLLLVALAQPGPPNAAALRNLAGLPPTVPRSAVRGPGGPASGRAAAGQGAAQARPGGVSSRRAADPTEPGPGGLSFASQYPGADIGARVNAAIAALPSGCGVVVVPAGTYSYATEIVKPRCVILEGQGSGYQAGGRSGGTVLRWTPATGVALAIGDGAGAGAYAAGGVRDLTLLGPGKRTATSGLWLGGDPRGLALPRADFGESQSVADVRIRGFGTGVEWGSNAWVERLYHDEIYDNGAGVGVAPGATDSAEQNDFVADDIFNNSGPAVAANEDFHFIGTSFDFNGAPSAGAEYVDCHFEQTSGLFVAGGSAGIIGGFAYLDGTTGSDAAMFRAAGASPGEWYIAGLKVGSNHPVAEVLEWSLPPNSKLFVADLRGNGGGGVKSVTNAPYLYGSYVNAQLYQDWNAPVDIGAALVAGSGAFRDSAQGGAWNLELDDDGGDDPAPYKFLRVRGGSLQVLNSAFSSTILGLTDAGALSWGGGPPLASSAQTGAGSLVLSDSPTLTGIPAFPPSYTTGGNTITQPASAGTLALTSQLPLAGATDSIGGAPLSAGRCASGSAAIAGAVTGNVVLATPAVYPGDGAYWEGWVSAPGVVEVKVCAAVAVTPLASTYTVRVLR